MLRRQSPKSIISRSFTKLDNLLSKSPQSLYFRTPVPPVQLTLFFPNRTRNRLKLEHPTPGGFASNGYNFKKRAQLQQNQFWRQVQCRQVKYE